MQGHDVSGCLLQDKINQKPGQAPPSWQIADAYVVQVGSSDLPWLSRYIALVEWPK